MALYMYMNNRDIKIKLIEEVRRFPLLHNLQRSGSQEEEEIWDKITKSINYSFPDKQISIEDCKTHWRNIQSFYVQEKKVKNKTNTSYGLMEHLTFLDNPLNHKMINKHPRDVSRKLTFSKSTQEAVSENNKKILELNCTQKERSKEEPQDKSPGSRKESHGKMDIDQLGMNATRNEIPRIRPLKLQMASEQAEESDISIRPAQQEVLLINRSLEPSEQPTQINENGGDTKKATSTTMVVPKANHSPKPRPKISKSPRKLMKTSQVKMFLQFLEDRLKYLPSDTFDELQPIFLNIFNAVKYMSSEKVRELQPMLLDVLNRAEKQKRS